MKRENKPGRSIGREDALSPEVLKGIVGGTRVEEKMNIDGDVAAAMTAGMTETGDHGAPSTAGPSPAPHAMATTPAKAGVSDGGVAGITPFDSMSLTLADAIKNIEKQAGELKRELRDIPSDTAKTALEGIQEVGQADQAHASVLGGIEGFSKVVGNDPGKSAEFLKIQTEIKELNGKFGAPESAHSAMQSFSFGPQFTGGVNVAADDVAGDGIADIVVKSAPYAMPSFSFDPHFLGGVWVAAGIADHPLADVVVGADAPKTFSEVPSGDGADGPAEVIKPPVSDHFPPSSLKQSPALQMRLDTGPKIGRDAMPSFVFDPKFFGGVRVAVGDLSGDGAYVEPKRAPTVVVFDGSGPKVVSFSGGVNVAADDVAGDGIADIVVKSAPTVVVFDGSSPKVVSFSAYDPMQRLPFDPTDIVASKPAGSNEAARVSQFGEHLRPSSLEQSPAPQVRLDAEPKSVPDAKQRFVAAKEPAGALSGDGAAILGPGTEGGPHVSIVSDDEVKNALDAFLRALGHTMDDVTALTVDRESLGFQAVMKDNTRLDVNFRDIDGKMLLTKGTPTK